MFSCVRWMRIERNEPIFYRPFVYLTYSHEDIFSACLGCTFPAKKKYGYMHKHDEKGWKVKFIFVWQATQHAHLLNQVCGCGRSKSKKEKKEAKACVLESAFFSPVLKKSRRREEPHETWFCVEAVMTQSRFFPLASCACIQMKEKGKEEQSCRSRQVGLRHNTTCTKAEQSNILHYMKIERCSRSEGEKKSTCHAIIIVMRFSCKITLHDGRKRREEVKKDIISLHKNKYNNNITKIGYYVV